MESHILRPCAASRYRTLLNQALRDLEADPERPGSRSHPGLVDGARLYQLSMSRGPGREQVQIPETSAHLSRPRRPTRKRPCSPRQQRSRASHTRRVSGINIAAYEHMQDKTAVLSLTDGEVATVKILFVDREYGDLIVDIVAPTHPGRYREKRTASYTIDAADVTSVQTT